VVITNPKQEKHMSMKKKLMVAATVATIGIGGLGASVAHAATSTTTGTSIVDKLVAKFGLKKADVQAVFDAERAERQAARLTQLQTKLATAVTDGKITQTQSDAIVAKFKENQATRDANKDTMDTLTDTERKAKMDAERTAFDKWVTDSGIPTEYARLAQGGGHGHGGPGGPGGDMTPPTSSTSN
jgi:hypothetical protein